MLFPEAVPCQMLIPFQERTYLPGSIKKIVVIKVYFKSVKNKQTGHFRLHKYKLILLASLKAKYLFQLTSESNQICSDGNLLIRKLNSVRCGSPELTQHRKRM